MSTGAQYAVLAVTLLAAAAPWVWLLGRTCWPRRPRATLTREVVVVPPVMVAALRASPPALARDILAAFACADEAGRRDMIAFFESDGPRKVREKQLRAVDGTPTADELARWPVAQDGAP